MKAPNNPVPRAVVEAFYRALANRDMDTAKYLGPRANGQKPGDVMMGNGMKMNVLEIQKMGGAPPQRP